MAKINLTNVGDSHTMLVAKCEVVEGNFGEDVKFTDAKGDSVFINRKTADRQLLRIGFGEGEGETATVFYGDVDGTYLTFSRAANAKVPSKPYWNIDRAVDDTATRPSLAARAKAEADRVRKEKGLPRDPDEPVPETPRLLTDRERVDAIDRAYAHAYQVAVKVQGKTGTPDSLAAQAATLVIAYGKDGLLKVFAPSETDTPAKPTPKKADPVPPPDDDDAPDYDDETEMPF